MLVYLDQTDLGDIGVQSVGHRLRILKAIYELIVSQDLKIDGEYYIPPTVREATKRKGVDEPESAIVHSFEIRDERMGYAENEIKRLGDGYARLREDLLPIFRMVKESKPLPTPDAASPQLNPQMPTQPQTATSPTTSSPPSSTTSPPQSSTTTTSPAANFMQATIPASLLPTPRDSTMPPVQSPSVKKLISKKSLSALSTTSLKSPTGATEWVDDVHKGRKPGPSSSSLTSAYAPSIANGLSSSGASTIVNSSSSPSASEPFKSFRVTMEDPCYKVLPAALRKYKISGDWRQYALLVCYDDQERLLGLEEKPLIIFKELQDAGKRPVFMLRHIDGSINAASGGQKGVVVAGTPGGVL